MLKNINIVLVLLVLSVIRAIITPDMSYAIIILSLSGLYAGDLYIKANKTPDISEDVKAQLDEVKSFISNMSVKSAIKPDSYKRFF